MCGAVDECASDTGREEETEFKVVVMVAKPEEGTNDDDLAEASLL